MFKHFKKTWPESCLPCIISHLPSRLAIFHPRSQQLWDAQGLTPQQSLKKQWPRQRQEKSTWDVAGQGSDCSSLGKGLKPPFRRPSPKWVDTISSFSTCNLKWKAFNSSRKLMDFARKLLSAAWLGSHILENATFEAHLSQDTSYWVVNCVLNWGFVDPILKACCRKQWREPLS